MAGEIIIRERESRQKEKTKKNKNKKNLQERIKILQSCIEQVSDQSEEPRNQFMTHSHLRLEDIMRIIEDKSF